MAILCKSTNRNVFVLLFLFRLVTTTNTCISPSDTGEIGKKLPNSTFMVIFEIGIHLCFKECEAYAICLSINFNPTTFMCELNSQKKNESLTLDNDSSFIYKEIPGVLDYTGKKCGTLSCKQYSKCVRTRSKEFVCIAVGCADPAPDLENGRVAIKTFSPPSVTFECNPGYTGVGTKNIINCPPGGKWSSLSYRCEPSVMLEHVAFHAVAYSSTNVTDIIFDHVITNIGGGYDNVTGVFTVSTTGLYVFSWTIETYGQLTEGALLVNGMQAGLSKAHQSFFNYDTSTSFAVLNLTVNDKLSVRVITGRAEARHTMFSGWKINKTDDTAFNALLSRAVSSSLIKYKNEGSVNSSHIVYDNETLDTDNAYSTSTGNFVAPRSGLYIFMMSALSNGSSWYSCTFHFSNGTSQPKVWVRWNGYYNSVSYMTFAWLDTGDAVYVDADNDVNPDALITTSVFAGWQLVDKMSVSRSTYPAFLASLSGDFSGTPVVFGTTYSGYHHGYSTTTGIFTADRDGVYVFLYNIEAQWNLVRATLNVNGIDIFETRSDGRSYVYDETSTAVSVLQLSSGDKVYVELKYGTVSGGESMFFGVLLFEL
ncbi:uncharacterized protein LOC125650984 [Ostrea edulis]|uniref:uncharacterized protein LOC125650984 n=1 Tax=Ostrea edulis TaxID=37623 RepID=UPI0024AF082E|nr:uncharacterized protein LOC125650984 [Ostrea edulis]